MNSFDGEPEALAHPSSPLGSLGNLKVSPTRPSNSTKPADDRHSTSQVDNAGSLLTNGVILDDDNESGAAGPSPARSDRPSALIDDMPPGSPSKSVETSSAGEKASDPSSAIALSMPGSAGDAASDKGALGDSASPGAGAESENNAATAPAAQSLPVAGQDADNVERQEVDADGAADEL